MMISKMASRVVFPAVDNLLWQLPRRRQPVIYLTFDDGPYPEVTAQILRILAEFGVSATFFLSGEQVARHREELSGLDYTGHRLGSHGYHHEPHILMSQKRLSESILRTDEILRDHFPEVSSYFRPPYGIFGRHLLQVLNRHQKDLVFWSLMSNDFKWPPERVLAHLRKNLENGDIVVFHDSPRSSPTTVSLLPAFISFCRESGFSFSVL